MERTVLTFSAANIVTVNLMVFLMAAALAILSRMLRGNANG